MTNLHHNDQAEPFFITAEVEAELIAAGYQFEPPSHFATMCLPEVLAGLTNHYCGERLSPWAAAT